MSYVQNLLYEIAEEIKKPKEMVDPFIKLYNKTLMSINKTTIIID